MKPITASIRIVSILMLVALALGAAGNLPVRAAPTSPEAAPPAGLSAADWAQIKALIPPAQQAYLKASNTDAIDQYGWAVAVSGYTAVVGAIGESSAATGVNGDQNDDSASMSGAVYVYTRSGTTWSQQAYLKASNTGANDFFGHSVAITGDTIIVGAVYEDSNATGVNGNGNDNSADASGAAYVFIRSGTTWSQQAYLKASNTEAGDRFGYSVAIWGGTVVVGTPREDSNTTGVNGPQGDNSAVDSGAAYVFVRDGVTWTQQAYVKASNTGANDNFGNSVAIYGNTLAIGAYFEDSNATGVNGNQNDNSANDSGAAYVFTRSGTTWSQQAYLKASNTGASDYFGYEIAIHENTIVVGARYEDSNATGVNGNQGDNSAAESGAAYVFTRDGVTWTQQAYVKASNTGAGDQFGNSVAVSGDTLLVGAPREDSNATGVNGNQLDNSAINAGAAYVFTRSGTTWSQQAYVKASNTGADDFFGMSVAISNDTLIMGAYWEDSNATGVDGNQNDNSASASGAAYVFLLKHTSTIRSAGAYDGHILESGETTNAGGTLDSTSTVFRLGDAAGDKQYRAILSFNTGGLPDNAVITKVTLKIKKQGVVGTNPFTILGRLKADIRKPYFGTFPGLQVTDFQAAANKVFVGTFTINPVNNWYIAVIGSAGYPYINKTGTTQFRLRFYKDDNDDGAADYMKFYSGNYIYTLSRPALLIEYYVP